MPIPPSAPRTAWFCRTIACVLALVSVVDLCANGPESFSTHTWTAENGLPDNSVSGLAQTPDGYLWVATQTSLARFDGFDFIPESLGETTAVTARLIRALYSDRQGRVWAALESGSIRCFSPSGVTSLLLENATTRDWVTRICEDRDGVIWMSLQRGGVCRIEHGAAVFLGEKEGVPNLSRGCICADRDGAIWLSEGKNLAVFREGRFRTKAENLEAFAAICPRRASGVWFAGPHGFRFYSEAEGLGPEYAFPNSSRTYDVSVLLEDQVGRVWIGNFGGGLFCWDGHELFTVPTPTDDIFALVEDHDGNIWVGAEGGGLTRIRPRRSRLLGAAEGLPTSSAHSIAADQNGSLWIVSRDGEITEHKEGSPQLTHLPPPPWSATCLTVDMTGQLWLGTGNLGIYAWRDGSYVAIGTGTPLASDAVRALFATSNGEVLASGQTSGIHRMHAGQLTSYRLPAANDYARAFAEDSEHTLWAGTLTGRLLQIREDGLKDCTPAGFPSGASIRALAPAADGGLWIGFAKHGLAKLSGERLTCLRKDDGLWSETVSQIAEDGHGNLWMGGNRGYFHITLSDFDAFANKTEDKVRSHIFGPGDSLPALQASFGHFPSTAALPGGKLAFATSSGVLILDPAAPTVTHDEPPVHLRSIEIDGRAHPLGDGAAVTIPAGSQRFGLQFTAISLSAPENVHFRYQMEGYESGWISAGNLRTATYSRVPPGQYVFRVQACGEDGRWNHAGATVRLSVTPYFWQTKSFQFGTILGCAALSAAATRHFLRRKVRRAVREMEQMAFLERERSRIARDMHDDLGATLMRIAMLGDLQHSSPQAAEKDSGFAETVSKLARGALRSMDEIVWAINPHSDTSEHLLEYLGQYAAEYLVAAGIRCRLDFPQADHPQTIPSDVRHNLFLATKEALRNVVKHSGATEVNLRAQLSASALTLVIEDNGRGFLNGQPPCLANGLQSIQIRLAQSRGTSRIESTPSQGTRVILTIPLPS